MLGKKLFLLILDLNISERKLLFYKAKKSSDKRQKQFQLLLGEKDQSTFDFQNNLEKIKEQLASKGSSEKIKNDQLRRFIDFCIKEVEDLKIDIYTKQSQPIRHYILSEVYNKVSSRLIYEDYLSKLNSNIKHENNYWLNSYYLNCMSRLKLLDQTEESFKEWRGLLAVQIDGLQSFYQAEFAGVVEKISSSFVDDKNTLVNFKLEYLNEEYLLKQIELVKNTKIKAILLLSIARLNINNEIIYPQYSSDALRVIKNNQDTESDFIRRKVYFASFLHTFHFDHPVHVMKKLLNKIIKINEKLNTEEPKIFFYLFLLQIISHDAEGEVNVYYNNVKKYFSVENSAYLYEFLEALEFYKNSNYKGAKRILNNLSITDNPYIASWSRCLEIAINYKQGDYELSENLLKKEMKRLSLLSNRFFTINSSVAFTIKVAKLLNVKVPVKYANMYDKNDKLSPFHKFILKDM